MARIGVDSFQASFNDNTHEGSITVKGPSLPVVLTARQVLTHVIQVRASDLAALLSLLKTDASLEYDTTKGELRMATEKRIGFS